MRPHENIFLPRLVETSSLLPPAFELIPRLLVLLDDSDVNSDALADVIRIDPGLTADVLQTANSAYAGGGVRVETLRDALVRLGLREVYRIVMKIVASPVLMGTHNKVLQRLDLWKHSLATAIGTQVLAAKTEIEDTEVAFTAGLLHDIGKVVLANRFGDKYGEAVEQSKAEVKALYLLEQNAFQTDHAQAGASLLQGWNFPEKIIDSIQHHHEPKAAHVPGRASLVYAANIIAYRLDEGYGFPPYTTDPAPEVLELLNLDFEGLQNFESNVKAALEKERARFR